VSNVPEQQADSRASAAERDPPGTTPALRRDVHLFYLDGAGVVFSEKSQTLHLLNPTSALILSLLQEGHDRRSTSAALQDLQGIALDAAAELVDTALGQWRAHDLLEGDAPEAPPLPPPAAAPATGPEWRSPWPSSAPTVRYYRLLGSTFEVRFADDASAQVTHPVLAHLEVAAPTVADVVVDVIAADGQLVVYRDRESFATCERVTELAPIVKSLVWITAVNRHEFLLDIHAGVVGNGTACLLLPAAAGSGKSTLTAALVHAGYLLYSDEVALLAEDTLDVFPVPLAIGIKSTGIEPLASRFPGLRDLPQHDRADGKQVAYWSPPAQSLPATPSPCPVGAIVFPRYAPGTPTQLERLPAFDALRKLLDECLVLRSRLDFARVERLVRWIGSVPSYSLAHDSVDAAMTAIRDIFPVFPTAAAGSRVSGATRG